MKRIVKNVNHFTSASTLAASTAELEVERIYANEWLKFLMFFNRVHNYSTRNIVRIFLQRPDATMVANSDVWAKAGRKIKRGEKGIKILSPVIVGKGRPMRYETSYVFDVSQTYGNALPKYRWNDEAFCNLQEPETLLAVLQKISPCPMFLDKDWDKGEINGYFDTKSKEIHIKCTGRSEEAILRSTIHEVVHARMHQHSSLNRAAKEIQSESVTFIVLNHFGYKKHFSLSREYIAGWAGQMPNTDLVDNLLAIGNEAKKLIAAIEAEL